VSIHRVLAYGLVAIASLVSNPGPANAQAVGSRVEVSPFGLETSWFPGTVLSNDGSGCQVRLDPRPGYGKNEEYYVQLRWVRASISPPPGPAASTSPGSLAASSKSIGTTGDAASSSDDNFVVGQRVSGNNVSPSANAYWKAGTITKIISPGVYEVLFDHNGLKMAMRKDFLRAGATARTTPIRYYQSSTPATSAGVRQTSAPRPGKGSPPDGLYQVNMSSGGMHIHIGTLEIRGNTYRGLNKAASFHSFGVDGSGSIALSGGLSGMPDGFKLTSVSFEGSDHYGRPFINIRYVGPTGTHDVMNAVRE
jgi:hypothetical protein